LEYYWNTIGILLEYYWNTIGILLEHPAGNTRAKREQSASKARARRFQCTQYRPLVPALLGACPTARSAAQGARVAHSRYPLPAPPNCSPEGPLARAGMKVHDIVDI
jgi:hypothetical protein